MSITFYEFPPELKALVFSHLDRETLLKCRTLSKQSKQIIDDNFLKAEFELKRNFIKQKKIQNESINQIKDHEPFVSTTPFLVVLCSYLPTFITEIFLKLFPNIQKKLETYNTRNEIISNCKIIISNSEFIIEEEKKAIKGCEYVYSLFGGYDEFIKIPEIKTTKNITPGDMNYPIMRIKNRVILFNFGDRCTRIYLKHKAWFYQSNAQTVIIHFNGVKYPHIAPVLTNIINNLTDTENDIETSSVLERLEFSILKHRQLII